MHGLAADTDLEFLVGSTLGQVCIGEHQVILNLLPRGDPWTDPGTSITVESSVRLEMPTQAEFVSDAKLLLGPALVPLLGATVTDASVVPPGTLRLAWSSGHILDILDSHEHYESYVVQHGDRVIVV